LVGDNTNHREIAGSYLLRQGLFYPELFFIGTGSPAKGPFARMVLYRTHVKYKKEKSPDD